MWHAPNMFAPRIEGLGESISAQHGWDAVEDRLNSLHGLILAGDRVASSEFAEISLPLLERYLRNTHPHVDQELVWDACTTTVLDLCERPEIWKQEKLPISRFLKMSARADLKNAIDRSVRKSGLDNLTDPAVFPASGATRSAEDEALEEDLSALVDRYAPVLPLKSDREVFLLMISGVRDEREYARALGVDGRPPAERKVHVKRAKDRIKQKIRRAAHDAF